MSAERDETRIVRSWLEDGVTVLPDRVLDAVLDQLPTTPQRRAFWPARRPPLMNTYFKIVVAAVAVVVLAVIGAYLLPRSGGFGNQSTPSPSRTNPPSATATQDAVPPAGALEIGRHMLSEDDAPFSLAISTDGWSSSGVDCSNCAPGTGWLQKGPQNTDPGSAWMPIWSINGVYADPCTQDPAPVAETIDELAAAVAGLPGMDVSGPTDVTVGGFPAKHLVLTVGADIGCAPSDYNLWYDDVSCGSPEPVCGRWVTALHSTIRVWIVDIGDTYAWIEAETYDGANAALNTEIQRMVDSIQFE